MSQIGENIKRARRKKGISQEELARAIDATKSTISKYELGHRQPPLDVLRRIAAALGTTVNWLLPPDNYWEDENGVGHTEPMTPAAFEEPSEDELREHINESFSTLNHAGQQKAVERVEELTEVPKYRREAASQSTPAPPEGKDTTPPKKPPGSP